MSHETPSIVAEPRERVGSRYAQRLRKAGRLPAVIYGHKTEPVHVSVDEKEVLTHLRHGSHVFNVQVGNKATETCLVKDLQFGYLGDNVIHLDFARVDLDEQVHVQVHLNYVGQPAAASKAGAILNHDVTELEVICKVNAIPEELKVDQNDMESTLTVADIAFPPGVRPAVDESTLIAHISYVGAEEPTGEEVEVEGAAEPEVITEAKPDGSEG